MPKAKWGAGDNPLTAEDIDNAEVVESRARYSGELPPAGTYRFTLGRLKKDISTAGNDKVVVIALLDGSWRKNHKQYDGAPVFHHLALTKKNSQQVRNFLDAIGGTSKDLMQDTITDEAGYITKMGRVGDPEGIQVYITVQHSKTTPEYPNKRLEVSYAGYIMVDDADPDADDGTTDADGGDEPPF